MPKETTNARLRCQHRRRSASAPEETPARPALISSAMRPPIATAISASRSRAVRTPDSSLASSEPKAVWPALTPLTPERGAMVTCVTREGAASSTLPLETSQRSAARATSACPASCTAASSRAAGERRRSSLRPTVTLSRAASKSARSTARASLAAAAMAASLTSDSSSAPDSPPVRLATSEIASSAPLSNRRDLAATRRICSRAAAPGRRSSTRRSKRPGRSSAGSSMSARLVEASTITAGGMRSSAGRAAVPLTVALASIASSSGGNARGGVSKPSMALSRVLSPSALSRETSPDESEREAPMESISSM
mmetsp:Transcript_39812/g.98434  ORF Transcript_39812/g.98434 Transcript_39812/m.98434 type:complete len:311 (-) Transcript_39812:169-1101(-)